MNKRPLVNSSPVSEFGEAMPEDFADPEAQDRDLMYVPGFSELRRQRDLEMAEYVAGQRLGKDVSTLPVNVMWIARTRGAGDASDSIRMMKAANDGYAPVRGEMVGQHSWLTRMPPGAKELPDGTIVNAAGDLMLAWCTAGVARRNEARKARKATQQLEDLREGARGRNEIERTVPGVYADPVDRSPYPRKG